MDRSAIISFIASEIEKILGVSIPVNSETTLDDLPLDSLECLELTAAIEDAYNVDISCAHRISVVTAGDFADLVMRLPSSLDRAA